MRVLHVFEPPDGGVARHVRDLAAGQIARGHSVQAVVSAHGPIAAELRRIGAGVIALDWRPEITAVGSDLRVAVAVWRVLRAGRWDVVHTHGNKAGAIVRPLADALGLTVVHTPHGFAYATQEYRPRGGQALRRALTLGVERVTSPAARMIVTVSEAERAEALRDRIAEPERLMTVHNGISAVPRAAPDQRLIAWRDGRALLGFAARLHPQKAPMVLLDALDRLREQGIPFRAALVGDGPLSAAVHQRVATSELQGRVLVLPFSPHGPAILAAFDVFVLPSLWESLPIALLEAMSTALPVVAADVGGVREAVVDGETGLLHPRGDSAALAAALERLLSDEELRARLGAAGRARQAAEFSLEKMVDGVELAYERALEP